MPSCAIFTASPTTYHVQRLAPRDISSPSSFFYFLSSCEQSDCLILYDAYTYIHIHLLDMFICLLNQTSLTEPPSLVSCLDHPLHRGREYNPAPYTTSYTRPEPHITREPRIPEVLLSRQLLGFRCDLRSPLRSLLMFCCVVHDSFLAFVLLLLHLKLPFFYSYSVATF